VDDQAQNCSLVVAGANLRDIAPGEEWAIVRQESGWIRSLEFSPSGRTLAVAGEGLKIVLWDRRSP
jgi:hypothetical protein